MDVYESLQSSEYKHTSLIGTVIITPPAKEIKSEHQDRAVKTEQDWLSLPKNIPKENISLSDPNVHPRLIHKDGSICHSKTYWKSLNKKPPLKEFELPDLFSDDEDPGIKDDNRSEPTTNLTVSNENTRRHTCRSNEIPDVEKPKNAKETMMTIEALPTKGNTVSQDTSVNTENNITDRTLLSPNETNPPRTTETQGATSNRAMVNEATSPEKKIPNVKDITNINIEITNAASTEAQTVVTTETDTKSEGEPDNNNNMPEHPVNTDNIGDMSTTAMTVNTAKTNNHENSRSSDVVSESEPNITTENTELQKGKDRPTANMTVNTDKTNHHESLRCSDVTSESEPSVTTEKTEDRKTTHDIDSQTKETSANTQTSSTQHTSSTSQKSPNPKEDWASLMFHSDDSLFDEMTKQLENNQDRTEPITNEPTSTATQNSETLPDIVNTQNKTETATGLLMLSLNPKDVDVEIDNERDMPIDPKAHNKVNTVEKKNKQNTQPKNSSVNKNQATPRRTSRRSKNKNRNGTTPPKSTLPPKGGKASPKNAGSPCGVLTVKRYNLRKGTPNKYVHKPLKCTMCDQEVNSKSELRDHHQKIHNIISCGRCNKGFATNESLRKHSYTHTAGNSYECLYCKISFTFPSELDAHMIKHESTPNHSCNIVGCKRSYFRKAELTAHIKTHDGKLWKCPHKNCSFEAIDKRYLMAHKKKHSNTLNYHCRHCTEGFKYFEQRKRHEKTSHGK